MLLLTGTAHKIQIITSGTANIDVHTSYMDYTAPSTATPGILNTLITTAATTDVTGSPASGAQRNVQTLIARNSHASSSNTVTVQHTDGTTVSTLLKYTLLAGETLFCLDKEWYVIDSSGGRKLSPATGRYLKTTVITSGTTFTSGPSTNSIFARLVAGGGAGGGCTSVAAAAAAGGGGSAGGYAEKTFAVVPNTVYTIAIGLGGTGASGANGNTGGNTTIAVGGVTVTAFGGLGGILGTALTTLSAYLGGASPAVSTNGDLNLGGEPGGPGLTLVVATPIVSSGKGGSCQLGPGANGITTVGNGPAAPVGFGGGGGGAATGASTVRTGGNGAPGAIIIDEFA